MMSRKGQESQGLDIGLKIDRQLLTQHPPTSTILETLDMQETYIVAVNGITYDVCIDDDSVIWHISTLDPAFKTAEGLSVGTKLSEVTKHVSTELQLYQGSAYFVSLL